MSGQHQRGYLHLTTAGRVYLYLARAARDELHRWKIVRTP